MALDRYAYVIMALSLVLAAGVYAQPVDVSTQARPFIDADLSANKADDLIKLTGNLNYQLSQKARDALDNGLPLTFITEIKIKRPDSWLFQQPLWAGQFTQHIHYHALSHQYLVKDMQSGFSRAFLSLESSLDALGEVNELELINLKAMKSNERYQVELKTQLDIASLPTPLKPIAYLSDEWRLQGTWSSWLTR